ncbi:hypothetical protein BTO06_04025 [Tenacibaculum sp. SZ-18]|uniref:hypothetical protein n=1 Tax=Tenacibaculum sp. SZ-18 TaxID=754423 RepID=UPI000C2D0910|nr:hypothetical protein [Tenacibaculum sp. SZ-18]AUC13681.1 hypothetical protein BTO06_00320 [Tenacibaculum sp. SZ-18]AUC14360.1 hypothetical protein BTO06_04025 [Tenacibaculum sp. SZ-18]
MRDLSSKRVLVEILEENGKRLTSQMVESATQGNIRFLDSDHYLRKAVVGGSNQQLIDSETRMIDGVSTFKGTQFQHDRVEIIDKIKIGYDSNANENHEGFATYQKALPGIFRNARLKISQGSKLLGDFPLYRLGNKYTGNSIEDDFRVLTQPIVIVGGVDFELELIFPKGYKSNVTDYEYLEIATSGISVFRKDSV